MTMLCVLFRYTKSLEPFYDSFDPQFLEVRRVVREVLQKEADLQEIVQLVGKARSEPQPGPSSWFWPVKAGCLSVDTACLTAKHSISITSGLRMVIQRLC